MWVFQQLFCDVWYLLGNYLLREGRHLSGTNSGGRRASTVRDVDGAFAWFGIHVQTAEDALTTTFPDGNVGCRTAPPQILARESERVAAGICADAEIPSTVVLDGPVTRLLPDARTIPDLDRSDVRGSDRPAVAVEVRVRWVADAGIPPDR